MTIGVPWQGFLSIADQAARINLEVRFSQTMRLFRHEHPERDFMVISPEPTDTLLFERSFLSFRDRLHLLCCGYLSVVEAMKKQFAQLHARFARHGLSISLARIEERMRKRKEQLAGAGVASSLKLFSCQGRTRWSSAF